jgi:hypothetical protein
MLPSDSRPDRAAQAILLPSGARYLKQNEPGYPGPVCHRQFQTNGPPPDPLGIDPINWSLRSTGPSDQLVPTS